jgi:fructose-bisphosphate aldolase class I
MILKPNMVLPGLRCRKQQTVDEVADATVRCLSPLPWELAFSFARAMQQPVLEIWQGVEAHVPAAQQAL